MGASVELIDGSERPMDFPVLFVKTVLLRPYVFVFLAVFLFASIQTMGRTRTLVFWFGTWITAFLSEFSSTRNGFPYGWYHYTESTRGQELFISNVPFMDSLSYSFLLYAAYSLALFTVCPLRRKGWDFQIVDDFRIRSGWRVLLLTTLYMTMIDVIIDPVALQGERWFLGKIYFYDYRGHYFGVPLSNALGWGVTGFAATLLYQTIERRWLGPLFNDRGIRVFGLRGYLGIGLYFGVLLFNLCVTAWIQEWGLLIAGCFIFLMPTVLFILRFADPRIQATEDEWQRHLREFRVQP